MPLHRRLHLHSSRTPCPQLLAAFKSLERASILFVASWLALGASWAPHAGGWQSKRGVPGHSLAILGLGTLALGGHMWRRRVWPVTLFWEIRQGCWEPSRASTNPDGVQHSAT